MKRSRNLGLEQEIVKLLKSSPKAPKSTEIAREVGAYIDTTRLTLMDMSTAGITHRSQSGRYRLQPE